MGIEAKEQFEDDEFNKYISKKSKAPIQNVIKDTKSRIDKNCTSIDGIKNELDKAQELFTRMCIFKNTMEYNEEVLQALSFDDIFTRNTSVQGMKRDNKEELDELFKINKAIEESVNHLDN